MDVRVYGLWRKLRAEELMLLNCGVGEDSWESLGQQEHQTSQPWRKSILNIHWKDGCWSWNSNTLATWCKGLTHLKRPWCWERLKAGGEGDDRRWDGWMASPTQCTWIWVSSGSWWWTGRSGVLQSTGSKRVGHDWATELIWLLSLVLIGPEGSVIFLSLFVMFIPVSISISLERTGIQHFYIFPLFTIAPFNTDISYLLLVLFRHVA